MLDITTTELCDELVGGVLSAGPDRLEAAGRLGLPQVVSLGALDMVNFGARATVPAAVREPQPVRAQPVGHADAHDQGRDGRARAPDRAQAVGGDRQTALFIPLKGVSMIDAEGQPFHDAEADAALFQVLRDEVSDNVELIEMDHNVNDPEFADAMADKLDEYMKS